MESESSFKSIFHLKKKDNAQVQLSSTPTTEFWNHYDCCNVCTRNWKEGIGACFDPSYRYWGGGHSACHVWGRVIVPSDLARSLGAIYVIHAIPTIMNAWFTAGLAMKKICRYNNSPPHIMTRWLPQLISLFKFPCVCMTLNVYQMYTFKSQLVLWNYR